MNETRRPSIRRFWRSPWFWAALTGVLAIPLLRPMLRHVPEPPPVLFQLPAYSLTDQDGKSFGSEQLAGGVYVANFFFTRCPSICPRLTRAMRSLQDRYAEHDVAVKLLSISVDPEVDRPAKLAAYAKKHGADPARWRFLTGGLDQIRKLATEGFKTHVGEKARNTQNVIDIAHTAAIMLVDANGNVRGIFSSDKAGLDEVFHRSIHVSRR